MSGLQRAVLAALLVSGSVSAALAGPAIATRYTEPGRLKQPRITQAACLARAETVIAAAGFENIEGTQQSRYGTRGGYTAAIRCVLEKQIIIFIVSGPSRQISDQGAAALFQRFEAAP